MRSRLLVPVFAIALIGTSTSCEETTGLDDLGQAFRNDATWVANLTAEVQGAPATATGRAWFVDRGNTIDYYMEYSGLSSNATNAHIHRGSTGGAMVQMSWVSQPSGTVVGSIDMARADVGTNEAGTQTAQELRDLLNSGGGYVNVHSVNFGGGEIRGTIERQ